MDKVHGVRCVGGGERVCVCERERIMSMPMLGLATVLKQTGNK